MPMIGWIFRGCALAVLSMFVLFVLIILGSMGIIKVPLKTLAFTFCAIAVFLMAIPIVIGFVIRTFFKKLATELEENAPGAGGQSTEIHLTPLESGTWEKPSGVRRAEDQLASLGFADAGEFSVAEMKGLKLHAMMKASERVWAVVYDFPNVGAWVDLVIKYEDGTSLTVSNAPTGGTMDPQPGHAKVYDKEADAVGLYEKFKESRSTKPAFETRPELFAAMFEKSYRDEMAWRAGRGGPTREEVRRVAIASGKDVADDVIDATHDEMAAKNRPALEEILQRNFVESKQVTEEKWHEVRARVVFIHDQMSVDEAVSKLGSPLEAPAGIESAREAFTLLNLRLPIDRRGELLGRVNEPVQCDVYLMPDDAETRP